MKFWASAEVYQPADRTVEKVRRCVEPSLNAALAGSSLGGLDVKLRYEPIVMPAYMQARYPARTEIAPAKRTCDCAPQLDYEIFLGQDFDSHVAEYVRGIATAVPYLRQLGLTDEQVDEFLALLDSAAAACCV